ESGHAGFPGQHGEGVQVGKSGEFRRLLTATEQGAVTVRLQVGHRGAVQVDTLDGVAFQVSGGDDLGDDPSGDGDYLVVDEFDAVLVDLRPDGVECRAVGVAVPVLVECGGVLAGRGLLVDGGHAGTPLRTEV